jgi:hypothetical protein
LLFTLQGNEGEERQRKRAGGEGGRRIDGAKLSSAEIDQIAEVFLDRARGLISSDSLQNLVLDRTETKASFLVRMIRLYDEQSKRNMQKLMEPLNSSIFGSATKTAWQDSVAASERLRQSIEDNRKFNIVNLPPLEHPMRGTNKLLNSIVDQVESARPVLLQAAELIVNLDATVRNMHADFTKNSIASDKKSRHASWIAIAGIALTLIGLLISTAVSYRQLSDNSIVEELKALRAEHARDRAALDSALSRLEAGRSDAASSQPINQVKQRHHAPSTAR